MSWKKNTVNMSEVDTIMRVLSDVCAPFVQTLGDVVVGAGNNDVLPSGLIRQYTLRKLEYKNTVILERLEKTRDCDEDDVIRSYIFSRDMCPTVWDYVIYTEHKPS